MVVDWNKDWRYQEYQRQMRIRPSNITFEQWLKNKRYD